MITSILVPVDGAERVGEEVVIVVAETGDPAGRIAERAQANSVELIVMGRCGSGDLAGLLFGKGRPGGILRPHDAEIVMQPRFDRCSQPGHLQARTTEMRSRSS